MNVDAAEQSANFIDVTWSHHAIQKGRVQLNNHTVIKLTNLPSNSSFVNEIALGLRVVYDAQNNPLGAFFRQTGDQAKLPVEGISEAVGKSREFLVTRPTEEQLKAFCGGAEKFFINLQELGHYPFPPAKVPLEFSFHLQQFIANNPKSEDAIWKLIRADWINALPALWAIETEEQLNQLLSYIDKRPADAKWFMMKFHRMCDEEEWIKDRINDTPLKQEVRAGIIEMGRDMFRALLGHYQDEKFSAHYINLSFSALDGMFDLVAQRPFHYFTPAQWEVQGALDEFFDTYADDPSAIAAVTPLVEYLWVKQIKTDDPEGYKKAAIWFYTTMGEHLNTTATETTGDTEQELDRLERITRWLDAKGWLPQRMKLLDAGGHSGERILVPYLSMVRTMGKTIDAIKVDLLSFASSRTEFQAVEADLADPQLVDHVGTEYHLVTCTWSVLNDISPHTQQLVLDNFSRMLTIGGTAIIDVPMGYEYEIELYHRAVPNSPIGVMERSFTASSGKQAEKRFFINPTSDLLAKVALAGFRLVNAQQGEKTDGVEARYTTSSGRPRWTLVLEKVTDPHPSLAEKIVKARV